MHCYPRERDSQSLSEVSGVYLDPPASTNHRRHCPPARQRNPTTGRFSVSTRTSHLPNLLFFFSLSGTHPGRLIASPSTGEDYLSVPEVHDLEARP